MDFEIIPARDLERYVGQPRTLIIDLRDKPEYDCYHIDTAINIPYEELDEHMYQLYDYIMIIVYCERGNQSLMAARKLSRLGYHVINVAGGMSAYLLYKRRNY